MVYNVSFKVTPIIEAVYLPADVPDPVRIYSFGHVAIFCTCTINITFLLTFSRTSPTCDVVFNLPRVGLRGIDFAYFYSFDWTPYMH